MTWLIAIIFLILGLIIGSFLNVVIFRFQTQKSFGGRSMCMTCKKKLAPYELVPVFSFLFLKGRCAGCRSKISIQYPIIELITGFLFFFLFLKFNSLFFLNPASFILTYAFYSSIFSLLLIIAIYDLKHKIIPDVLSFFFGLLSLIGLYFFSSKGFSFNLANWFDFLPGFLIAIPFALLWFFSKGAWMGLGDAKLALGLGWFLGMSQLFPAILISFWSGALIGVFLIIFSKKYSLKSEIPFGPFLIFGSLLAFLLEINLIPIIF